MLDVCFSENLAHLATHHFVHIDTFIEVKPLYIRAISPDLLFPARECKGPKDTFPLSMWLLLASGFLSPIFLKDF